MQEVYGYHDYQVARLLEGYQAEATWLSSQQRLSMQGVYGYQVIIDCWKVIRPI